MTQKSRSTYRVGLKFDHEQLKDSIQKSGVQVDKFTKKIEEQSGKGAKGFAKLLTPITAIFAALKKLVGFVKDVLVKALKLAGIAIGAVTAAVAAFTAAVVKAANRIGEMADAADQIGTSIKEYQALSRAMISVGAESQYALDVLKTLNKAVGDVAGGNAGMIAYFKMLRVSVRDSRGEIRETMDILFDLLEQAENLTAAERQSQLAPIVGEEGVRFLQSIINAGGPELIRDMANETERLGVAFTKTEAAQARLMKGQVELLKLDILDRSAKFFAKYFDEFNVIVNYIRQTALPAVTKFFEALFPGKDETAESEKLTIASVHRISLQVAAFADTVIQSLLKAVIWVAKLIETIYSGGKTGLKATIDTMKNLPAKFDKVADKFDDVASKLLKFIDQPFKHIFSGGDADDEEPGWFSKAREFAEALYTGVVPDIGHGSGPDRSTSRYARPTIVNPVGTQNPVTPTQDPVTQVTDTVAAASPGTGEGDGEGSPVSSWLEGVLARMEGGVTIVQALKDAFAEMQNAATPPGGGEGEGTGVGDEYTWRNYFDDLCNGASNALDCTKNTAKQISLALQNTVLDSIGGLDALSAATDKHGRKATERSKALFKVHKAFSLAKAITSGYASIQAAMEGPPNWPYNIGNVISATLQMATNIANIKKTKFGDSSASTATPSRGSTSTPAAAPAASPYAGGHFVNSSTSHTTNNNGNTNQFIYNGNAAVDVNSPELVDMMDNVARAVIADEQRGGGRLSDV